MESSIRGGAWIWEGAEFNKGRGLDLRGWAWILANKREEEFCAEFNKGRGLDLSKYNVMYNLL